MRLLVEAGEACAEYHDEYVRGLTSRLSNGCSRNLRNHEAAVALNYFAYSFVRIHRTLRMSPAMAVGVTTRLWGVSDIVELLQEAEAKKAT